MRDGFGRRLGVGLLLVAGAALGQTAGNSSQTAAGKLAQATPAKPAFISATVKPAAQPTLYNNKTPNMFVDASTRLAVYYSMSLKQLIGVAYGVTANDVTADNVSGLAWLDTHLYDIVAKMPAGASVNDAPKDAPDTAERPLQAGRSYQIEEPAGDGSGGGQGRAEVTTGNSWATGRDDHEAVRRSVDQANAEGRRAYYLGRRRVWFWTAAASTGGIIPSTGAIGRWLWIRPDSRASIRWRSILQRRWIFSSVLKLGLKLQLSTRKVVGKVVVDHAAKMPHGELRTCSGDGAGVWVNLRSG